MRSFTDTAGREWKLNVTVAAIKRVREATGVMLPALFDDGFKLLGELTSDVVKLVDCIYSVVEPEADLRGVSPQNFGEALGGDALASATEALVRSTADFFSSPDQRASLHKVLDTILETAGKFTAMTATEVNRILATADTESMAKSCLDFVTSGQASRAATPIREPQENCS